MRRFFPGELTLTAEEALWAQDQAKRLRQSGRSANEIWQRPDDQFAGIDRQTPRGLALLCLTVANDVRHNAAEVNFTSYLDSFGEYRRMAKWVLLILGVDPQELLGDPVQERIGQGGFGVVFKVWRQRLNRHEAVKIVPQGRYDPLAEARYHFDSPNVLKIYSVDEDRDGDFLIRSELLSGALADRLHDGTVSGWPEADRVKILVKVASACQALHAVGVCHLDIKPSNILLRQTDSVTEPVLADFGIARSWTDTGKPLSGTWPYAAPEQCALGDVDARADVYALGRTFQEVLAGKPFASQSNGQSGSDDVDSLTRPLCPDNPDPPDFWENIMEPELRRIVARCVAPDKMNRYPCAGEVSGALEQWLSSQTERHAPRKPRGVALPIASLAFGAVAILFVAAFLGPGRIARTPAAIQPPRLSPTTLASDTVNTLKTVVARFELVVARKEHHVDRMPFECVLHAGADEDGNAKSLDDMVASVSGNIYSITAKYVNTSAARFAGKFYTAGGSVGPDRWKTEKRGEYWYGTYVSNNLGNMIYYNGGASQDELRTHKEMRFELLVEYVPADANAVGCVDLTPNDPSDAPYRVVPVHTGRDFVAPQVK